MDTNTPYLCAMHQDAGAIFDSILLIITNSKRDLANNVVTSYLEKKNAHFLMILQNPIVSFPAFLAVFCGLGPETLRKRSSQCRKDRTFLSIPVLVSEKSATNGHWRMSYLDPKYVLSGFLEKYYRYPREESVILPYWYMRTSSPSFSV